MYPYLYGLFAPTLCSTENHSIVSWILNPCVILMTSDSEESVDTSTGVEYEPAMTLLPWRWRWRRADGSALIRLPSMPFGLPLLLAKVMYTGVNNTIPPVTYMSVMGQALIYINPIGLGLPTLKDACLSVVSVWDQGQWRRLFLAPFYHINGWHLHGNMMFLLQKGMDLEMKLGRTYFAYMLFVFTGLSSILTVGLSLLMATVTGNTSYPLRSSVGFSGVLFALKMVSPHIMTSPDGRIKSAEIYSGRNVAIVVQHMIVTQMIFRKSSFIAHYSGFLIGLLYIKGPLKKIMDLLHSPNAPYKSQSSRSLYQYLRTLVAKDRMVVTMATKQQMLSTIKGLLCDTIRRSVINIIH